MVKKRFSKALALILAVVMVICLAACGDNNGGNGEDGSDVSQKTADGRYDSIVIGFDSSINEFSPENPQNSYVGWLVYETLYTEVPGGEMSKLLAKNDYEVVDDLHYNIEIYDNIHDTAGNSVTAEDVAYSYTKAIEFATIESLTQYVKAVTALDPVTVQFEFTQAPNKVGILRDILCKVWIFSQAAYEASTDGFATKPVATGAYYLSDFVVDSYATLTANDDYWQTDESALGPYSGRNVETIRFDCITESSQMIVALKNGKIDYATNISDDNIKSFVEGAEYAEGKGIYSYLNNKLYFLTPNTSENSPLQDENLRKALFYAIDNEQLCNALNVEATTLFTECSAAYPEYSLSSGLDQEENYITQYDPELAKDYLAKSSWNGESLKFLLSNDQTIQNVGTIIQALVYDNLGITIDFLTYDNATVKEYKNLDDMWDLVIEDRASSAYAMNFLMGMFDRDTKVTFIFADDDDKLAEVVTALKTQEGLTEENWANFHHYLVDRAYVLPMFTTYVNAVYNSDALDTIVLNARNTIVPGACTYK